MVKNKAIPIILAASFILSPQTVFAQSSAVSKNTHPARSIHKEHNKKDIKEQKIKKHTENSVKRSSAAQSIRRDRLQNKALPRVTRSIEETTAGEYSDEANYYDSISGNYNADNNYNGYNAYNNYDSAVAVEELPLHSIDVEHTHENIQLRQNLIEQVEEVNNIRVNGSLPQITGMNTRAANRINERIRESFLNLVNAGHRNIESNFEVYNWGGMTSLVVRYQTAGSRQIVKTFVFDNISKNEVTLRNLLGRNFISYINNRITQQIRDEESNIYNNITFRTIRANQGFYVADGKIHIVFEQEHIAPRAAGVVEFVLPIENLNYSLSTGQFIEENGNKFISATVARRFGMDIDVTSGGVMHISNNGNVVRVNVHNELKNPSEVMYINGVDVALSSEFFQRELGINIERAPGAQEVLASHRFAR